MNLKSHKSKFICEIIFIYAQYIFKEFYFKKKVSHLHKTILHKNHFYERLITHTLSANLQVISSTYVFTHTYRF